MAYTVELTRSAARELRKLDRKHQVRIAARIDQLADDPRPADVKKLSTEEDLYRVRIGDYRILYQIQDDRLLVLVVRIGHRGDVYRRL